MMIQKIAIGLVAIIAAIVGVACGGNNCGNMCDPEWVESATVADYQAELDEGADPNAAGGLPLSLALEAVYRSVISTTVSGDTPSPLADAASDVVQLLIDSGADPNLVPEEGLRTPVFVGRTPLSLGVGTRDVTTMEILLKAGADPNPSEADPPLLWVAMLPNFQEDVASLLIAYGADIDARSGGRFAGANPLHIAAAGGKEKATSFLLENGADPNAANLTNGDTPLHHAAYVGELDGRYNTAGLLLQYGAKKDVVNDDNLTPCQVANYNILDMEWRARFSELVC